MKSTNASLHIVERFNDLRSSQVGWTIRLEISHRRDAITRFAIRWIMLDNSESSRSILPWEWQLVSPTRASIRAADGFFSKQKLLEGVFWRRLYERVRDRNILLVFHETHYNPTDFSAFTWFSLFVFRERFHLFLKHSFLCYMHWNS